jgi:carbonic anhydrase
MKTLPRMFLVLALALPMNAQTTHSPAHWGYEGDAGPAHWGDLNANFSSCKSGREQSPIDIRDAKTSRLPAINFDYKPSPLRIIDNGHTVQVNHATGSSITVGDKTYQLLQIHFHHPSEERISGKSI